MFFDQLPHEMIRGIFSFSGKWWLKRNQLVNIEKLYQIKRPIPIFFPSYSKNKHLRLELPIMTWSSYNLITTYWDDHHSYHGWTAVSKKQFYY